VIFRECVTLNILSCYQLLFSSHLFPQAGKSLAGITAGSLLGVFSLGMFFPWANAKVSNIVRRICVIYTAYITYVLTDLYVPAVCRTAEETKLSPL
jgi:branched-subunit amino acid ABC-type transport system permease component